MCEPGGRLNIKMPSYQYRDFHVKDKTVSPTILSLTWESPYTWERRLYIETGPSFPVCLSVSVSRKVWLQPAILSTGIAGKKLVSIPIYL